MQSISLLIWLLLAIIFFFIESATYNLVCIWFSFGAFITIFAALFGLPLPLQMAVFLLASVSSLLLGRGFFSRRLKTIPVPTNADRVIGQIGVVTQSIDSIRDTGRVHANGLDWTARSHDGSLIPAESLVDILKIDGVKLIVRLSENNFH